MNSDSRSLGLGESATRFLSGLPVGEKGVSQQEVYRFVRWYGRERALDELTAPEVASYANQA